MEKNFQNFPMNEAQHLAETPTGQQLMKLLQQNGGVQLDEAVRLLREGNTQEAKDLLMPLMTDPNIRALLRQLGG